MSTSTCRFPCAWTLGRDNKSVNLHALSKTAHMMIRSALNKRDTQELSNCKLILWSRSLSLWSWQLGALFPSIKVCEMDADDLAQSSRAPGGFFSNLQNECGGTTSSGEVRGRRQKICESCRDKDGCCSCGMTSGCPRTQKCLQKFKTVCKSVKECFFWQNSSRRGALRLSREFQNTTWVHHKENSTMSMYDDLEIQSEQQPWIP